MTTLLNNLDALDGTIGLETMCVAGGHGAGDDRGAAQLTRWSPPSALRLHGQHLPLAHRRGRDALPGAEAGCEDEIEIDSAGTGGWHVGDPPDAARDRGGAAARDRRSRARRGRSRRRTSSTSTCSLAADRENVRDLLRRRAGRGGAREGPAAARVRPRVRRATSTCPTPTTAATAGFENVLDMVEAACRGLLDASVAVSLDRRRRAPAAAAVERRLDQRGVPRRARRRPPGVRQDARATPGRRVRGRGGRRWPGWPSRARVRRPRGARGRRRRSSRCSGSSRARSSAAGEEELGRGLAGLHAAGAPASAPNRDAADRPARARRRPRRRRLADVLRRAARCARCCAGARRGAVAPRARGGRRACASGWPSSPARPSRPPACTATCGAATSSPTPTGARGWSTPPPTAATARSTWRCCGCSARPSPRVARRLRGGRPARRRPRGPRRRSGSCFPLLVHAVLFGGGYGASAEDAARRYVG